MRLRYWQWHRRCAALMARVSPITALERWSYSGWEASGFTANWRTRTADYVLWKYHVGVTILRCLAQPTSESLRADYGIPWWQAPLYRAKAIVCLLAGRHWRGAHYEFEGAELLWWNGEMVGYYEPEWEQSSLEVGMGLGNWRVLVHLRELH